MEDIEVIVNGVVSETCRCGDLAPTWTSWTNDNPGRRFTGCPNYKDTARHCNYFAWIDPEVPEPMKMVILGNYLRKKLEEKHRRTQLLLEEIEDFKLQVLELKEKHEKMKDKYFKMKANNLKNREREKWYLLIMAVLVLMLAFSIFNKPTVSNGFKFLQS